MKYPSMVEVFDKILIEVNYLSSQEAWYEALYIDDRIEDDLYYELKWKLAEAKKILTELCLLYGVYYKVTMHSAHIDTMYNPIIIEYPYYELKGLHVEEVLK